MADVLVEVLRAARRRARRTCGDFKDLEQHWIEIHRLENEGDRLYRDAVAALFSNGPDPMVVIRWKDLFAVLERAIDATDNYRPTSSRARGSRTLSSSKATPILILVIVVVTALAFDYTNGFHDTANVVATLDFDAGGSAAQLAVLWLFAAVLNFVGAFLSLAVAATIASGHRQSPP